MKVHRYRVECFESFLEFSHGMGRMQQRLYVPGQGVIGYRDKEKMDVFFDDPDTLQEAEEIVSGKRAEIEGRQEYLGTIELPDELIIKAFAEGTRANEARKAFQDAGRTLVEKIPD